MKLFAAMGFGLVALVLAGCGFRPLYASDSGGANRVFSSIYVAPIEEDTGYELRNSLIDLLDTTGATHDGTSIDVAFTLAWPALARLL